MSEPSTLERLHRHFAQQLGCSPAQLERDGIEVVAAQRPASAEPFWALVRDNGCVVSVSPEEYERAERLIEKSFPTPRFQSPEGHEWLLEALTHSGRVWICGHGHQFYCDSDTFQPYRRHSVRHLSEQDIPLLRQSGHFLAGQTVALERGDAFAVVRNDRIVSYAIIRRNSDHAWEIAVATSVAHRGCGFAKAVVSAATEEVHLAGRVAVYACDDQNAASRRVAEALGYQKYADDYFCVGPLRR